jgi:PAS domain S-box-containing protein
MTDPALPAMSATSHSDELFRVALEAAPTGMLLIDASGTIVLVNAQVERLFGYDRAELVGSPIERLVPKRYRQTHPPLRDSYFRTPEPRGMGVGRDLFGVRKDGSEVPVEIGLTPVNATEGRFVLASIVDITERHRALDQLQQHTRALATAIRERDVLLQEVHHRVKNNLQLITSLINMQSRKVGNNVSRAALMECKRRVEAIGLIHEKLYESHDYAQVPFSDYVRTLAGNLIHATELTERVVLHCECDRVQLPVAAAISCGLLLNELITTVLMNPDGMTTLRVELRRADGHVVLTVRSNAVGRFDTTADRTAASLSLQLIEMLAQQLDGSLRMEPDGAIVTFPLPG